MAEMLATLLFTAAGLGIALLAVQVAALWRHLRAPPPPPATRPGVSILKPLCGHDDELEQNLASFVAIDYPAYELLLGVRSRADTAWPIAEALARRHPERIRVIEQEGEPGGNPKVNQLIGLAAAARHRVLVVSDSNVRVEPGYLDEVAGHLADRTVGLVTHLVVGEGERRLGSRLDGLHLACHVTPGLAAAKHIARHDIVVGKSMALRRADLDAIGGFAAFKDVLAEDYVMGRAIIGLGKRIALARAPVVNVSCDHGVGHFYQRYRRWSVIHRQTVALPTYLGVVLLYPLFVAGLGALVDPSLRSLSLFATTAAAELAVGAAAAAALGRGRRLGPSCLALPLADLLLGLAWTEALFRRTIVWRGNRLRVSRGTRLNPAN